MPNDMINWGGVSPVQDEKPIMGPSGVAPVFPKNDTMSPRDIFDPLGHTTYLLDRTTEPVVSPDSPVGLDIASRKSAVKQRIISEAPSFSSPEQFKAKLQSDVESAAPGATGVTKAAWEKEIFDIYEKNGFLTKIKKDASDTRDMIETARKARAAGREQAMSNLEYMKLMKESGINVDASKQTKTPLELAREKRQEAMQAEIDAADEQINALSDPSKAVVFNIGSQASPRLKVYDSSDPEDAKKLRMLSIDPKMTQFTMPSAAKEMQQTQSAPAAIEAPASAPATSVTIVFEKTGKEVTVPASAVQNGLKPGWRMK